ncbi:MAG: hypothetical protein JSS66_04900 [Armatimonadetes bacterium]|nr:hypothetical protein [Armatimonadota bacterium]
MRTSRPPVEPQVQNNPAVRETCYVQNPFPGIHHISDIDLTFGPFEVKDLLWEKADLVSGSFDLARSLNSGSLVRISQDQYEAYLEQERQIEQNEVARGMRAQNQRMVKVDTDRGSVDAEYINVNAETPGGRQQLSIHGSANDPKTYAMAYQVYCQLCARSGQTANPRDFHAQIERSPRYLQNLLDQVGMAMPDEGMASGDTHRGRATVALAPDRVGGRGGTASVPMTNFGRDQYVAGGQELNITSSKFDYEIPGADDNIDLLPDAEEIDLMLD